MTALLTADQVRLLRDARSAYCEQPGIEHYDEVLREVTGRAAATGTLSKADIGALLFWKRLRADTRWAANLHRVKDDDVRAITGGARSAMAGRDDLAAAASAGRNALSKLPGFGGGDALASAVLTALDPERMAVYDRRAHAGLGALGLVLDDKRGRYARYMTLVQQLAEELAACDEPWSHRDVDLALFKVGGQRS